MKRIDGSNRSLLRAIARRAMLQRGLLPDFSEAVRAELSVLGDSAGAALPPERDLRELLWCSIDNDDSRDLDQLTVAQPITGGAAKILVAVADVGSLVQMHTATDDHARSNTTSVYTPAEIFPMLPEKLSTDLTSLVPGQSRLAVVIELAVGRDGSVVESDVYRAVVRNHAKLAYDGVAAWLQGGSEPAQLRSVPALDEQLRLQDRVAQAMKERRHEHGALSLDTHEATAVFDGDVVADLLPEQRNRAKELIEDFMIAANAATAKFLEARGFPSMRRVLRAPKRWDRIVALAATLGKRLPPEPDAVALEAFLCERRRADPERFPDLSLSVVKLLGSGEYVLRMPGQPVEPHFGLAVRNYTHSTAPNRRFPDLVTQRLLKAALAGSASPYAADELAPLATHCSDQEDNAAKVEREVRKSAAALLLASRIGELFDGLVTGAASKGTWVRIARPAAEGRVVQGFEGLDVGDRVRVRLVSTDVQRGFIDFARMPNS